MTTGKIGVTTEDIFPVIKKFLYSDHEIFLRELVSNAIDASRKLRTLSTFGDYKGEVGELDVRVSIDKEAGTLTVSDKGIGMDAEDIEKYINRIAFSGAKDFLEKYKDTANTIIGHFGLGFYSAFMVSKKVVIRSLSCKEGAKAVEWTCDGSPAYEMQETDKAERGTDVILYIDDDSKEFLETDRVQALLRKYCRFMPFPVICGKVQEWKDGKMVDTDKDNIVNSTEPVWTRKPADLTDEDYAKLYTELYPGRENPLFHIHLNVDYPFTLTGILYFPKIKTNIDIERNRIQLYCNQVYVTDQVEGVVPEFMTLLQGVIDSPDIPLNVSRSYLQADSEVKKISGYITKKVADRLEEMFNTDRQDFEKKWDDIRLFIQYGMLTDEKFCDAAMKFYLFKDVDGKYYTLEEYKTLVAANQTDKEKKIAIIYATDPTSQYSYIEGAKNLGYSVLVMDSPLNGHLIQLLESKNNDLTFVRVDSQTPERLVEKEDSVAATGYTPLETEIMTTLFRSAVPEIENTHILVELQAVKNSNSLATITQSEYMRRMKEMAETNPGMRFFADMPKDYNLVVNTSQPVVEKISKEAFAALVEPLTPVKDELETLGNEISELSKDKEKEAEVKEKETKAAELRKQMEDKIAEYGKTNPVVGQVVDLALLRSGLLTGENLQKFIDRSVALL